MRGGLTLLALCAGCGVEQASATQAIVVVGSDLPLVAVEAAVASDNGRVVSSIGQFDIDPNTPLPTSFTIVPARVDPAEVFRVSVTGFIASGTVRVPVVRAIAVGRFSAGGSVLLPIALSSACRTQSAGEDHCGCAWNRDGCEVSCAPPGFEQNEAKCLEVPDFLVLPSVTPGRELEELDQGTSACDPGEVPAPKDSCVDLNECAFGLHTCDHEPAACVNVVTGRVRFTCECPSGFVGDGIGPEGCLPSG